MEQPNDVLVAVLAAVCLAFLGLMVMAVKVLDERNRFRGAIRKHRAQRLDDRCWLDDYELYEALGDGETPDTRLPKREEFIGNCEHYYACRAAHTDPQVALQEYKRFVEIRRGGNGAA